MPLRPLIEVGCRIWFKPAPFDHSKLMVIDEEWSLVGSANWDTRSFRLNFELNVELHDPAFATRIAGSSDIFLGWRRPPSASVNFVAAHDGFTLRDVRRHQWHGLTSNKDIEFALLWLEDEDWIRGEEIGGDGPGSGRPTTRYTINPKCLRTTEKEAA